MEWSVDQRTPQMPWSSDGRKNTKDACIIPRGTNSQSQHQSCWCSCPHRSRPRWTNGRRGETVRPQNRMIYGVLACRLQQMVGINRNWLTHSETEEEAGLAHRGIADQEKLEQVITVEQQANKTKFLVHWREGKIKEERRNGSSKLTIRCPLLFPPWVPRTMWRRVVVPRTMRKRAEWRVKMLLRGTRWGLVRESKMQNLREVSPLTHLEKPQVYYYKLKATDPMMHLFLVIELRRHPFYEMTGIHGRAAPAARGTCTPLPCHWQSAKDYHDLLAFGY